MIKLLDAAGELVAYVNPDYVVSIEPIWLTRGMKEYRENPPATQVAPDGTLYGAVPSRSEFASSQARAVPPEIIGYRVVVDATTSGGATRVYAATADSCTPLLPA